MRKPLSVKAELLAALKALFADYKGLCDSGDAGFLYLEQMDAGKQAMAAIARAEQKS